MFACAVLAVLYGRNDQDDDEQTRPSPARDEDDLVHKMRLAAYAGTSALVAAGALLKAFHQRPNFYSATVYLSQSNACVLVC